jgi:transposase-like protein
VADAMIKAVDPLISYGQHTTMPEEGGRRTMALVYVHCPECQSINVVQYGKQANGTQRYRCNNRDCPRTIFLLQYSDKGRLPAVKQQIVDMTLNGSGVRDIVRVLGVSSATVIDVLKKKEPAITQVNERLLKRLDPAQLDIIIRQVEDAEMDEMWSFVQQKSAAVVMACH